eukprot:2616741-Prymnesium_polylepis.1
MLWFTLRHAPAWLLSSYLYEGCCFVCSSRQKESIDSSKPSSAGAASVGDALVRSDSAVAKQGAHRGGTVHNREF